MKQNNDIGNINRIKTELKRRLIVLRYSKCATQSYMAIFGWVEKYLKGYGEINYSKEAGQQFLAEYLLQENHNPAQFTNARTLIRRLDEILENKLFTPCFRESKMKCPPRFESLLQDYLDYLRKRGIRESTIGAKKRYVTQFFIRLPDTILTLDRLTAADLYSVFSKNEWVTTALVTARCFLNFLFEIKITKSNLSVCVPNPKRPNTLPSVYSGEEVARLLSAVDRTTCLGKRDYAVLMLASHLGLRSSDIVNLSLDNIDYQAKTIKIVQVKTSNPISLVMNSDIEEAIKDYVQNGRSQSDSDKIFLGTKAPFTPISAGAGFAIARKYFVLAGIAAQGRKRGPQALRMSFATALVGKGTPYAVVQRALGHEDPESSKHYVRTDVRRLKPCAIDVPNPTGAFAVMLGDLQGVL